MTDGASTSDAAPQDPRLGEITDFLDLHPTDDELRWLMPVTFDVAGVTGTLLGGCGLAAAVAALETVTGRPMAAASAQYLERLSEGGCAAITLDIGTSGNRMTQASAEITDAADGRIILRALVSLGGRQLGIDQTWVAAPEVPSPLECERRDTTSLVGHSFTDHADVRLAGQQPGDRHVRYWARLAGTLASTRPGLTALADLLPSGMRVSLDVTGFRGSSLDNTVRIAGEADSDWVLLDIESYAVHNAVGHGIVRIFAESGELLATGNQSFAITRIPGPPGSLAE